MSQQGAHAVRRRKIEAEFARHAADTVARVAAQFQPIYDRVCQQRDQEAERAAILQTVVERVATGLAGDPVGEAQQTLDQLGIVPDIR